MWELRQIFIRLFFVLLLFVPFACSDVSSEDSTEVENSVLNFTSRYARYPASLVSEKFTVLELTKDKGFRVTHHYILEDQESEASRNSHSFVLDSLLNITSIEGENGEVESVTWFSKFGKHLSRTDSLDLGVVLNYSE